MKKIRLAISKLCIKSRFLMVISIRWWVIWSNFYQILERKFMKKDDYSPDVNRVRSFISDSNASAEHTWEKFASKVKHWGGDPWYQGFDVISCPERTLYRGKGDCDDYALLAYSFFGEEFTNYIHGKPSIFRFYGIFSLVWEDGTAHAISVYTSNITNSEGQRCFMVVSNDNCYMTYGDFVKGWEEKKKVVWIGHIAPNRETGKLEYIGLVDNRKENTE